MKLKRIYLLNLKLSIPGGIGILKIPSIWEDRIITRAIGEFLIFLRIKVMRRVLFMLVTLMIFSSLVRMTLENYST